MISKKIMQTENLEIVKEGHNNIRVFLQKKEIKVEGMTLILTEKDTHNITIEEFYLLPFNYHIIDDSTSVLPDREHHLFQGHTATIIEKELNNVEISYLILGDRDNLYPSQNQSPLNEEYLSTAIEVIKNHPEFEFCEQAGLYGIPINRDSEVSADITKDICHFDSGPITFTTVIENATTYGEVIQMMDKISLELDKQILQQLQSKN